MEFGGARKRGRPQASLNGNGGYKKSKQEMESFPTGIGSKSKPCTKFFSTSGCPFGEGCHFLHYVPGGIKTVTQMLGNNPALPTAARNPAPPPSFPDGSSPPAVKTRMCNKYNTAEGCKFGDKCHFAHGEWELGKPSSIPHHHEDPRGMGGGPMGGRFGGGRMEPQAPPGLAASFGASATAKISVDASLAGAIIGKSGVNSKQICRLTGAKLSIREHESDPNLRNIELEGTFDQIKQASAMVRELIVNIGSASGPPPMKNHGMPGSGPAGGNFKTKICDNFIKGSCTFGERCHFAHGADELRRFLRDLQADGWERSDFPIICESCLGDNPYIRMTKADYDKECKICTRPFTVFRWRPGRDARYKKSEICQTCSKLKNVCQVCLLDLEYGLPVQVRDTALHINSNDAIPKSDVNREYFAEEHDRRARAGIDYESSYGKVRPSDTILKLQRTMPYYKRNRAHVCSFYVRGECTRGAECPYRHEMPVTGELSQQNIKDRYYGVNDPVAMKLLNKAGEMPSLEAPDDESIKTLYVGGLDARITEQDLRDNFYAHGEIESVRIVLQRACAFVTYTTREGAEKAAEELSNKLVIKGLRLKLMWGRPQAPKPESEVSDEARQQAVTHSGMLPRAVISQQQNQLQPPDFKDQAPPPMHYFNIPPPPPPPPPQMERAYYPSMDPQRMGALIQSKEGASSGPTGSGESTTMPEQEQQQQQQQGPHYAYTTMPPPPQVQFHQPFYPPYGYMPPPPPSYQQYPPPPYRSTVRPLPPPPPPQAVAQQYQQGAPPGSSQQ